MKRILLAVSFQVLSTVMLHAQQIKGTVKDEQGKPLNDATISLLKAKDSSVVKLALSKDGLFTFSVSANDSLLVSSAYVGYKTTYSNTFYYNGTAVTIADLVLHKLDNSLQSVTVTSRKPVVEIKAGKTILNIEGSINSTGSDALELLRKAPGVTVDKDDLLSINGKGGVKIYIDNKPSALSAQDLANYLRSIPSSMIEAIEIINNPSSEYEAAGTAGIINIRLKKNKALGLNGSANFGLSQSKNSRYDAGFSLNYRNKKVNAFGSYNYSGGTLQSEVNIFRLLKDTAFDQHARVWFDRNNHSFKTGLDYTVNAKNSLGILVNGTLSDVKTTNFNITPISKYSTGEVTKILAAANFDKQQNNNVNVNLNYNYKDSLKRSLAINADYGNYVIKQDQWQPNYFFDSTGKNEISHKNYIIESPSTINIYSLKIDYETTLAKGRIAFGGKASYVKTDNSFNQYDEVNGTAHFDKMSSNNFTYKENVNAAYIRYAKELKGLSFQAGIRAEQTNLKGVSERYSNTDSTQKDRAEFSRNYIDFFPSASVTLAPKTANQFTLSYSRRIDRPAYQDLNPFEYRINEYSLHKGSTDLRPQYSNTLSLTYTFRYKLNATLSYSHVKDMFGQVVDTAGGLKGYLGSRNIAKQDVTSLNISYPFQFKNYSLFANVNAYNSRVRSNYGQGRDINLDVWAVNLYAQNSVRFGKGWSAELTAFYASPSIWQGSLKTSSIWSADAGVQKQVMKGKGTVKASVSDLFRSMKWSAYSNFSGQQVWASGRQDSRQLKISFTYRFGNSQVKSSRQFQPGAEDENKRTQKSGGLGN